MTTRFRVDSLRLDTTSGDVTYNFPEDLTVLAGSTGVGKTTLLELIKYGLGGDGQLAPVVLNHVVDVHISISVGASQLALSRGVDSERRKTVRVFDMLEGRRLADRSVGGAEPTISSLLLNELGLEGDLRAPARGGRSVSAGAHITFNDVFRFMYVPQSEMNRDIAWSQQGYYDPKRKAVFELLFGLTSPRMLQMRSEINTLKRDIEEAGHNAEVVQTFLSDSGLANRFDAEVLLERAKTSEQKARATLLYLRGELSEAVDRESQVLRDLLNDAERSLADANDLAVELTRQLHEYEAERNRLTQEIDRLARMESAGLRLASIEFAVCPRCTQRLDNRDVPDRKCRVCLQDDALTDLPATDQYETSQLRSQLEEIDEQLRLIREQSEDTARSLAKRSELVRSLSAEIDQRTTSRVTPRLQAYADAAAMAERAAADQISLEQVLRQWDRAQDLKTVADDLAARRKHLESELRALADDMAQRKVELFSELDAEFQTTVVDFRIPSIENASINPESYLPMLNGQLFTTVSAGGGIITATQVAYWITLVTVAARRRDTLYPGFLMLDSPRLALNAEEDIAGQMYRRFAIQAAASPGRLQFIVSDNELPQRIERTFDERKFSYDHPTIASIDHPGPAHVETLESADSPETQ